MSNQKKIYVADEAEKASKSNYIKEHDPQELADKIVDAGSAKLKVSTGVNKLSRCGMPACLAAWPELATKSGLEHGSE